MNTIERRALGGLAFLYALRMLGLFMVLPVMLTFGADLNNATPSSLGMALGIYGITQAIFQIPLGWLSDRIGRKPVIAGGLLVFAAGSLVAALSDQVGWVIAGRALQGAGAIASSTMALLTDLTREQERTKALAVVGMTIGLSFGVAMILGPWIAAAAGLSGIFFTTAGLSLAGMLVLFTLVPNAPEQATQASVSLFGSLGKLSRHADLWRLDLGVFSLHFSLMALFVVAPLRLIEGGLDQASHGFLYVPVMFLAFALMVPAIVIAERRQKFKAIFSLAILLLVTVQAALLAASNDWRITAGLLVLYFVGFNYLEATMPSLISKLVPRELKGAALGTFNTSQFLGASVGGMLAGRLYETAGEPLVFIVTLAVLAVWLLVSFGQRPPARLEQLALLLPMIDLDKAEKQKVRSELLAMDGVEQVRFSKKSGKALVRVRPGTVNKDMISRRLDELSS